MNLNVKTHESSETEFYELTFHSFRSSSAMKSGLALVVLALCSLALHLPHFTVSFAFLRRDVFRGAEVLSRSGSNTVDTGKMAIAFIADTTSANGKALLKLVAETDVTKILGLFSPQDWLLKTCDMNVPSLSLFESQKHRE